MVLLNQMLKIFLIFYLVRGLGMLDAFVSRYFSDGYSWWCRQSRDLGLNLRRRRHLRRRRRSLGLEIHHREHFSGAASVAGIRLWSVVGSSKTRSRLKLIKKWRLLKLKSTEQSVKWDWVATVKSGHYVVFYDWLTKSYESVANRNVNILG